MKTFIEQCLTQIARENQSISDATFVLPSKRAGVFLKQALARQFEGAFFLPKIISIEELIEEISGLKTITNLEVMFLFYEVYLSLTVNEEKESFESFSKWAQVLLHDFNEIDRYRINGEQFFLNLSGIKQIEHWKLDGDPTEMIKNYLNFWKKSHQYYTILQEKLLQNDIGYQGLVYREASEQIEYYVENNSNNHYFLGFNALNACEEVIFQELLNQEFTKVFWDIDEVLLMSKEHNSSHFSRKYLNNWSFYNDHEFSLLSNDFIKPKAVKEIAVPKNIGQMKKVGDLLSKLPDEELNKTAVVLGDESLLLPLLNSLPLNVKAVNITMGLSLKEIPLAAFFECIFQLYNQQTGNRFYYKKIVNLFNNNYTRLLVGAENVKKLIKYIQSNNVFSVDLNELLSILSLDAEVENIFKLNEEKTNTVITVFQQLIYKLKSIFNENKENHQLDLEYLYRFYEVFNVIFRMNDQSNKIKSLEGLYQVYKEILSTETLDFQGEPVKGLQIMGMLESRVLDFERIILTSVNEGVLPSGKSHNSFIPFDMKIAFGLPTYYEKDAVYSYHFFRLMQRAKDITLLYNTEPDGLNAGEKSRFILQFEEMLTNDHKYVKETSSPLIPKTIDETKTIDKNEQVLNRLQEIAYKGFSPSALTQYIRNPIDFYQQKVLQINEDNEVEETVAANTLGTIVHNVLEEFYKPLENEILTKELIIAMQQKIDVAVAKQFKEQFKKGDISQGKNLIVYNIAKRYVANFLKQELQLLNTEKEVIIRQIESDLRIELKVDELDFPVYLTGKVDRVDEVDGTIRIIDYKTGKVEQRNVVVKDWEELIVDYNKCSKPFQILTYAYMMNQQKMFTKPVEGGIISFKNLQNGFLKFKDVKDPLITQETFAKYLEELKRLILEICNPTIPFIEKEI